MKKERRTIFSELTILYPDLLILEAPPTYFQNPQQPLKKLCTPQSFQTLHLAPISRKKLTAQADKVNRRGAILKWAGGRLTGTVDTTLSLRTLDNWCAIYPQYHFLRKSGQANDQS